MKIRFLSLTASFLMLGSYPCLAQPSPDSDVSGGYLALVEADQAKNERGIVPALEDMFGRLSRANALEGSAATAGAFVPPDGAGIKLLDKFIKDYPRNTGIQIGVASVLARLTKQTLWSDTARGKISKKLFDLLKTIPQNGGGLEAGLRPAYGTLLVAIGEMGFRLTQEQTEALRARLRAEKNANFRDLLQGAILRSPFAGAVHAPGGKGGEEATPKSEPVHND